MTNPTHPASGAADLPAIQRYKIGYHSDDWGQRSSTPSGIPDASGSWVRYADHVAALAAGQAVAPVVDDKTAGHAMLWRQHCDKLDALVTYCPTCCQGFIAQKEMTRDQIIYECGKTAGRATRPAPPAIDDPGPFLDDEGRAMVGTSHHYTADNIRALVAEYKALESGAPEAVERYSNSDHRTRAGVLWRVISALADEVPFAPPMDGGEDAARYQLLRRGQHWSVIDGVGNDLRGEALDAAVDSVRTKKGGTK